MTSVIKRLPWYYIIIVLSACAVIPYFIATNSRQQPTTNPGAAPGSSQKPLSAQTLSRVNGLNSTGPKSHDTGKLSDNK